jgi:hypothetical protein
MLERFADGVWVDTGPVRILGTRLTATMTVLRLEDGLLVHSPLPLTSERRGAVLSLGNVAHLYAPNTFHHLWLGEWSRAFPGARVHAPAALAKKRADLRIDRVHGDGPAAFGGELEEIPIVGFRLAETALVHHESRTAIVTDLVHNVGRPTDTWTRIYSTMMGFYDRVALSRVLRWTAFDDRGAARRSVDRLLDAPFEGLIVGHGAPMAAHGHALLAAAMHFLPATAVPRLPSGSRRPSLLSAKPCG